FFSSRRRHTRWPRDWSSDVCSSDLFTDIEASTALRTSLGDAAADGLFRRHDELIRQQIEQHRGHDVKAALGDGFLAVFASTRREIGRASCRERVWGLERGCVAQGRE